MNGQAAGDLWHLTIDDLLAAPADAPRLQGPGPFVINLSASTAPIDVPAAGLKGYEQLLLYQLKQTEDGRTRFRLRLGPIASELEADAILSALREYYPSAFATNAAEDDLKVFERKGARTAEAAKPAPNAPPAAPALALDAAGEVEAEIELPPAKPAAPAGNAAPAKANPATKATAPAEDSAEFAIDFDAFLPPMDLPAQASAPTPAPVAGSGKRKKREHKPARHAKVARQEVAKAAKPEAVKVANPEAAKAVAVPTLPEPTVSLRSEPAKFVEPAPDPNAVTDQVAVLAVPDVAGELTLDDA
ncbi:MAG TPA: hypothetical protein VFR59_12695, partial [Steroidobacteraceae bacterium]|nr:hypothetical protein [Steroidobacteraceae bacterium]